MPQRSDHIRSAELCATCHTLRTPARGDDGKIVGSLPEQMPYQEWLHSDYRSTRTCQSCHMPAVDRPVAIARTLGVEREGVHRHVFVAANFFMQRILGRYHDDLAVTAPPEDLATAADRTVAYMRAESAALTLDPAQVRSSPTGRFKAMTMTRIRPATSRIIARSPRPIRCRSMRPFSPT